MTELKSVRVLIGFFMFVGGIGLMIVADGIDVIFGIGLLFFIISIIIALFSITWSIAVTADRVLRRFTDGD